ncbi:MAG: ROK-family transcriptional regulator [Frondihabitans sp.]|nr:ROK-family transcriptional regulator [Frondihabitans sp.]
MILGNRAGAGILINGDIYSGFRGAAGEIVEAAGVVGLNDFDDHPIAWLTSPLDAQRAHALSRVAAARLGDPEALAEIDEFVTAVTPLLITLSWTIAPPLIVFGGGLEDAADLLLPRLEASMRVGNAPDIGLRASQLGLDAPLRGALKLVLDRLDSELFGPPSLPPKSLHD